MALKDEWYEKRFKYRYLLIKTKFLYKINFLKRITGGLSYYERERMRIRYKFTFFIAQMKFSN